MENIHRNKSNSFIHYWTSRAQVIDSILVMSFKMGSCSFAWYWWGSCHVFCILGLSNWWIYKGSVIRVQLSNSIAVRLYNRFTFRWFLSCLQILDLAFKFFYLQLLVHTLLYFFSVMPLEQIILIGFDPEIVIFLYLSFSLIL